MYVVGLTGRVTQGGDGETGAEDKSQESLFPSREPDASIPHRRGRYPTVTLLQWIKTRIQLGTIFFHAYTQHLSHPIPLVLICQPRDRS